MNVDELWQLAYETVLENHTQEQRVRHLDFLVNEHFPGQTELRVNPHTSTIQRCRWSVAELTATDRRPTENEPRRFGDPVVVVSCRGKLLLVDGTRRVKYWEQHGVIEQQDVLLITYKGAV